MKKNDDGKKNAETMSSILHKATDISKKVADGVQKSAQVISDKTKSDMYIARMKKYNPLFPDQYKSESFSLPKIIKIVDGAARKNVDVCEGAIGWIENKTDIEVLCLYDEAIEMSNLKFVPSAVCGAFYYVDNYNNKKFIRTDCIFSKAHEEKLAELEYIAYSLGAKACSIEIVEDRSESAVRRQSGGARVKIISSSSEMNMKSKSSEHRSGKTTTIFEGSNTPTRPELKWFANDESIKQLIHMRCSGNNSVKTRTLELFGASSATMSQDTAHSLDVAIGKISGKIGYEMEKQAKKESCSRLIFDIEF